MRRGEDGHELARRFLRSHSPEILVETPFGFGKLIEQAEQWEDTAALDAFAAAVAGAIEPTLDPLANKVGPVSYTYHVRNSGDDAGDMPRPHVHYVLGRQHEYLDMLPLQVQEEFSHALRAELSGLGFRVTRLDYLVEPVAWELTAVAERATSFPPRETCEPLSAGQRQFVPLNDRDSTRPVGA